MAKASIKSESEAPVETPNGVKTKVTKEEVEFSVNLLPGITINGVEASDFGALFFIGLIFLFLAAWGILGFGYACLVAAIFTYAILGLGVWARVRDKIKKAA